MTHCAAKRHIPGHEKKFFSTYPARIPLLRLDYIFSSPDIKVKEARVAKDRLSHSASDHLPVVVKIELP